MKTLVWSVIALGSGYLSGMTLLRLRTHGTLTIAAGIVMALLCISAVIRVGNTLGWWSLIYNN